MHCFIGSHIRFRSRSCRLASSERADRVYFYGCVTTADEKTGETTGLLRQVSCGRFGGSHMITLPPTCSLGECRFNRYYVPPLTLDLHIYDLILTPLPSRLPLRHALHTISKKTNINETLTMQFTKSTITLQALLLAVLVVATQAQCKSQTTSLPPSSHKL